MANKQTPDPGVHTTEVQEILDHLPSWIIRYGTLVVAVLLLILLAGAWLVLDRDLLRPAGPRGIKRHGSISAQQAIHRLQANAVVRARDKTSGKCHSSS